MRSADYRTYRFRATEFIRYTAEGILLSGVLAFLFYRSLLAFPVLLISVPFYLRYRKETCRKKRQRLLRDDFGRLLTALLFAVRAGRSAETAFPEAARALAEELPPGHPLLKEWNAVCDGLTLQIPADRLLSDFADRTGVEAIENFAAVFSAASRMGGDMAALMESAASGLSQTIATEREIETAFAAQQAEQRVMSLMPAAIILYMRLASPGFLDPLYGTVPGVCVMTVCLAVYAAAFFIGERITSIEV